MNPPFALESGQSQSEPTARQINPIQFSQTHRQTDLSPRVPHGPHSRQGLGARTVMNPPFVLESEQSQSEPTARQINPPKIHK